MNHEICMYEKCNEVLTIKYEPWNMLYEKCNEVWNIKYEWSFNYKIWTMKYVV